MQQSASRDLTGITCDKQMFYRTTPGLERDLRKLGVGHPKNSPFAPLLLTALGLRQNLESLLIAGVFKGQWTLAVQSKFGQPGGKMMPVPDNMRQHFQTLDLTVNRSCIAHKCSHRWATNEVQTQLESGKEPEYVKTDTKLCHQASACEIDYFFLRLHAPDRKVCSAR